MCSGRGVLGRVLGCARRSREFLGNRRRRDQGRRQGRRGGLLARRRGRRGERQRAHDAGERERQPANCLDGRARARDLARRARRGHESRSRHREVINYIRARSDRATPVAAQRSEQRPIGRPVGRLRSIPGAGAQIHRAPRSADHKQFGIHPRTRSTRKHRKHRKHRARR